MTNARDPEIPNLAPRRASQGAQGLYDPRNEHDACGVGFIADLSAKKSHKIIQDALKILVNLTHRGAVGADPLAGDGAGLLMQIPHDFLKDECADLGIELPEVGEYAVAHIFMPRDKRFRRECEAQFERSCAQEGLKLLGWRDVPTDNSCLSEPTISVEPFHRQVFVGKSEPSMDADRFERKLYVLRKVVNNAIHAKFADLGLSDSDNDFYIVSLSSRTIVYKGMFLSDQARSRITSDFTRPACNFGAGPCASALLDEHIPVLEARPPVPDGRPQRRDQHAAR